MPARKASGRPVEECASTLERAASERPDSVMRHQLPVYSPIDVHSMRAAVARLRSPCADPASELADVLRREYAADAVVLYGTGTQALQRAIGAALGRGESRPVALPAFTCFDVATAAVGAGARIALYDVDAATLAPDLDSLEAVLRAGAGAVVVAPLYGVPVAWEPLAELAARYGARVIEDAAQGHGASWRGRPLGSLGEISVLSFGRGKGWTAVRGGAVLVRGERAAEDRRTCEAGLRRPSGAGSIFLAGTIQWALGRPRMYGIPASIPWLGLGETHYREPAAPKRMGHAAAAFALATRDAARREAGLRRGRGRSVAERLAHASVRTIDLPDGAEPGYLRFPVRVADGPRAVQSLRRFGVGSSYPRTLAQLAPVRPSLAPEPRAWPGAETLVRELITLPTHSLVDQRKERVFRALEVDGKAGQG